MGPFWVGNLIKDINKKIVLVCPEGREQEAVKRLSRVGYDNPVGYLKGSFSAWKKEKKEKENISSNSRGNREKIEKKNKNTRCKKSYRA